MGAASIFTGKRWLKRRFPVLLWVPLLLGCQSKASSVSASSRKIRMSLVDSPYFTTETKTWVVDRGADFTLTLTFASGFSFSSCSYTSYDELETTSGQTLLSLHNIEFPDQIHITAKSADCGIIYHLNGGHFLSSEFFGDIFARSYDLSHHLRPNTALATDLCQREGYTPIGWNTQEDGKGEHIGLGSRVTLNQDTNLDLYLEWVKQNDASDFIYQEEEDGITLTAFIGDASAEYLTIPDAIHGKKVVGIQTGFASSLQTKTLILPNTILTVEKNAFTDCSFDSIYFFDNLETISDESFGKEQIPTWHISAIRAPVFTNTTDNEEFAEDMDRLILHQEDKKLIFFGGCSMSYGLKSAKIAEVYGSSYTVLDMGAVGGTNASFQFDCITRFLKAGDVVVHAPEVGSPYQLMYTHMAEARMFQIVESNYDLLSYAHMDEVNFAFLTYTQFNTARDALEPTTYEAYLTTYNEYGDISIERPFTGNDVSYSDHAYTYQLRYVTKDSLAALCQKYDAMKAQGATVYFSYSPTNISGLTEEVIQAKDWNTFATAFTQTLPKNGYEIISQVTDYLMLGRYFYDQDYHLNDVGAELRTERLLSDLQGRL